MFDTIVNKKESIREICTTVNEIKAPTDKSVELLKEMQEKALKSIISAYCINDNSINCSLIKHNSLTTNQVKLHLSFTINGKIFHYEQILERFNSNSEKYYWFVECINKAIKKIIIEEYGQEMFCKLFGY